MTEKKRMQTQSLFLLLFLLLCAGCGRQKAEAAAPAYAPQTDESADAALPTAEFRTVGHTEELESLFASLPGGEGKGELVSRGACSGDRIASRGDVLYLLRDYALEICRMDPAGVVKLGAVETGFLWQEDSREGSWSGREKQCVSLLLSGNRLVILSALYAYAIDESDGQWSSVDSSRSIVDIYDVTQPEKPLWMRSFAQSGSESVCLLAKGELFLLTERAIYPDDTLGKGTTPGWWQGEEWTALDASCLYACEGGVSAYVQLGVYPLETASTPDSCALLGCRDALLCERGFYGLIPGNGESAVYYLPIIDGAVGKPICSVFRESYASVSELTGAGDTLCLLQDGSPGDASGQWQRSYDEQRTLCLSLTENAVRLALRRNGSLEELVGVTLGWDFRAAVDADSAIFTDPERGLIGLPCEDGYSLYALEEGEFRHVLDCYSSDLPQNRRIILRDNILFVADRKRLFTIDLDSQEIKGTLTFSP